MNSKTKTCQNCKAKFTIEPEDFEFYEKIGVPEPTFCPDCRMQRRITFRNESKLYKRKCDFSGKEVISIYHKNSPYKVYDQKIWWSDKWDPMDYSRDYDFQKPFFEQFTKLIKAVPRFALFNFESTDSEYCNFAFNLKNCYLLFGNWYSEDCFYGSTVSESSGCVDNLFIIKCQRTAYCIDCNNCYQIFYSQNCNSCINSWFLFDCRNCQSCLFCTNLRHKNYHIFNRPVSKQEFNKARSDFFGSYERIQEAQQRFKELVQTKAIHKFMAGEKNRDVTGNFIYNSKNVKNGNAIYNSENIAYCQKNDGLKDSMDNHGSSRGELMYESVAVIFSHKGTFIVVGKNILDSYYLMDCFDIKDCFACIGLRHKQYCILNKQYTKEEYEELVPKIKKHMNDMPYTDKKGRVYKYGEFFPIELSPFAYNETIANEYFPLTKDQALKQGYSWYDKPKNEYKPTIKAKNLADNIKDVDNSILKEIIECGNIRHQRRHSEQSGESRSKSTGSFAATQDDIVNENCAGSGVFRIIPQELKFYKKMGLPLPHLCPDCRHRERIKQRNPLKLWERKCMKKGCNNTFQTTYAPDRKEIVYCEECYLKEVG